MVVTCDIQFENNPAAIFYAGQVISGKVTLTADKIKQVKAVTLNINGWAKSRWTERGSRNSSDTTYWGKIDYMNSLTCLLAPNATDQAVLIEPGIHTFSFACHTPANCPSSLECLHGHIRYIVQVSLVRPWKTDQTFTRGITVLTIKNLNYDSPVLKKEDSSERKALARIRVNLELSLAFTFFRNRLRMPVLVSYVFKTRSNSIS